MAIFNPLLGDLRGSIAANTWSANKGGAYVRRRTTPTNPQTSRQQTTRSILGGQSTSWSAALTQAQRDAWEVYAQANPVKNSLGVDVFISGLAWYVRASSRLVDAGVAPIVNPPIAPAPIGLLTLAVDISAAAVGDVTFTGALGAAEYLFIWASLPVSVGSTPNRAQTRLVGYSPLAQASPWAATLPHAFQSGERGVFYAAKLNDEGLISSFLQAIDDSDY